MNREQQWQAMITLCKVKEAAERIALPFCHGRGITPIQLRILFSLYFEGGQTVGQLAGKTGMAGANSSAQCKRLSALGYVNRQRDQRDERRVLIHLSSRGRALVQDFFEEKGSMYSGVLCHCGEEDRRLFDRAFSRLEQLMANKNNETAGKGNNNE